MKKTLLLALMAIVATSSIGAQENQDRRGPDPEKRIERQVKRLDKKLKLTEEQKLQLKEYYTEFDKLQQARMEQIRMQEKRERDALDNKIQSILTDEQKAKFAEMKEQEKEMWKNEDGFGPRHGPGFGRGGGRPMGGHGGRPMGGRGGSEFED